MWDRWHMDFHEFEVLDYFITLPLCPGPALRSYYDSRRTSSDNLSIHASENGANILERRINIDIVL